MADITHAQIMEELREFRREQKAEWEKLNGRVRNVEVCQASHTEQIVSLQRDVGQLKWLDKVIAIVSSVAAAIAAVFVKQAGG